MVQLFRYPGDRPIRRRRGGFKPSEPAPDVIVDFINSTINFDGTVFGLPGHIADLMEKDFKESLTLRYNVPIQHQEAIEEEYAEMPRGKGIGFTLDPEEWKKKGAAEVLSSTAKKWLDAVVGFDDLAREVELVGLWDRYLNPKVDSTPEERAMSLHAEVYAAKYGGDKKDFKPMTEMAQQTREYMLGGGSTGFRRKNFPPLQESFALSLLAAVDHAPNVAVLDANILTSEQAAAQLDNNITSLRLRLQNLQDPVSRKAVQDQISLLEQQKGAVVTQLQGMRANYKDIEYIRSSVGRIAELKVLLAKEKEVNDLQRSIYNTSGADARATKTRDLETLVAERDALIASVYTPSAIQGLNPKKIIELANEEKSRLADTIWKDAVEGKLNGLSGPLDDKRLLAWAKLINYRDDVFKWTELFEATGQGRLFQTFVWYKLKNRFKILGPDFYVWTKLVSNPAQFAVYFARKGFYIPWGGRRYRIGIPDFINGFTIGWGDNALRWSNGRVIKIGIGPAFEKFFGKIAAALAKNGAVRGVFQVFTGGLIRKAVNKMVATLIASGVVSGVGLPVVIITAALQYTSEKLWSLAVSMLKLDFFEAYEKFTKEFTRLIQACFVILISVITVIGLAVYLLFVAFILPFTGASTGDFGGVDIAPPPDGTVDGERKSIYIGLQKNALPDTPNLSNGSQQITYTIIVTAQIGDLTNIRFTDSVDSAGECSYIYNGGSLPPWEPPDVLVKGSTYEYSYSITLDSSCADTFFSNVATVTADVILGATTKVDEVSKARWTYIIGDPSFRCLKFEGFTTDYIYFALAAGNLLIHDAYVDKLCGLVDPVDIIVTRTYTAGPACGYVRGPNTIEFYQCGAPYSYQPFTNYLLTHETGHNFEGRKGGAPYWDSFGSFAITNEGFLPTYCLTPSKGEDFAETIAMYVDAGDSGPICAKADSRPFTMCDPASEDYLEHHCAWAKTVFGAK